MTRTILPLLLLLLSGLRADGGETASGAGAPEDFLLRESAGAYRLVETTVEGRLFRRVEGFDPGRTTEPGRPALPVRVRWIGVPEGYTIRATVESLGTVEIPGSPAAPAPRDTIVSAEAIPLSLPEVDDAFYRTGGWYPEAIVETGAPERFRHQLMVPVRIHPIQADPAGGTIRVHEKMVVRIRFIPDTERRADKRGEREEAPAEPAWEGLYRSTVANYDQALSYRTRPARRPGGAGKSPAAGEDEYKLYVREGGLYRIEFDELAAVGFPEGSTTEEVRIVRRGWSDKAFEDGEDPFTEKALPLLIRDRDGDGLFGDGDALLAWLPGFREDRMERDFQDRFADEAVYFLLPSGGGASFTTRPGLRGYAGLDPLPSFPDTIRWEEDILYEMNVLSDTTDLYFPWNRTSSNRDIVVDLPAPDTAAEWGWRAMTISNSATDGRHYHRYQVLDSAAADTLLDVLIYWEKPNLYRGEQNLPGRLLGDGENRFLYRGYRGYSETTDVSGAYGFLDWLEIRASFLYRARDDYLLFSSGEGKERVQMEPGGFTDTSIVVLDVTDPSAPARIAVDSLRAEGEGWTVTLQDSVESPRRYVACTVEGARRLGEGKIVRDPAGGLTTREASMPIISHDRFVEAMEPLAEHRTGRGLTAEVIRLQDVYDEFNGGVKDPEAIRRYLLYAHSRWSTPPTHALLVGDGYEDYKDAAQNYVNDPDYAEEFDYFPSYPLYSRYIRMASERWSASDLWYVLLDGPTDALPDILIGRFPVKTEEQAAALVEKTILYETERLDEPWRRRYGIVADDAWTFETVNWVGIYANASQIQFEIESLRLAGQIADSSAVRADTALFLLRPYTSVYQELCPHPDYPNDPDVAEIDCVIARARGDTAGVGGGGESLLDAYFDLVNERGVFAVNYQGHASRSALSHELFLGEGRDYRNKDHFDLTERSAPDAPPYIFMGFACDASEFEVFRSLGDEAITETMVLLPNTGAILSFGSTLTEHLTPNLVLNGCVIDRLYPRPAKESRAAGSRTAGEIFAGALADFAGLYSYDRGDILPWVIFGDPALSIGPFPPELTVTVDGDTIADGGLALGGSGGAPLLLRARFTGDVWVATDEVLLFENDAALPESSYTVEAGVDSASNRWTWTLAYDRKPDPAIEEIRVRFTDRWGNRLSHTLRTSLTPEIAFDGAPWNGEDALSTSVRLTLRIAEEIDLERGDLSAAAGEATFAPDTLYRDGNAWVAEFDLVLPEGNQVLTLSVLGWEKSYPIEVVKSAYSITASVDGREAASGHTLLGHLDGTAPEIVLQIALPRDLPEPSVRITDAGEEVDPSAYVVERDSAGGDPCLRVLWSPAIRNESYEIRVEADGEGAPLSAFLLRAGLSLSLTLDGAAVMEGDFIADDPRAEGFVEYADSLPAGEVRFELNGLPLLPDSLRRGGDGRWAAAIALEPGGGSHTLLFHAGAYSVRTGFRVDGRLRVTDALCHPNPAPDRRGFYYQLSQPADRVRIEIFTVSGKRIRTLENLSRERGYNENPDVWDGRDADGDRLARGVYPFRINAFRGGEKAEAIGTIVVGRRADG
ncbi:MAG: hypothetical protein JW958_03305 [Candidatus Eisenbacteria bacterium]|nr:hypothetical protein [Candidatus Eisenbacteria bacterium]